MYITIFPFFIYLDTLSYLYISMKDGSRIEMNLNKYKKEKWLYTFMVRMKSALWIQRSSYGGTGNFNTFLDNIYGYGTQYNVTLDSYASVCMGSSVNARKSRMVLSGYGSKVIIYYGTLQITNQQVATASGGGSMYNIEYKGEIYSNTSQSSTTKNANVSNIPVNAWNTRGTITTVY